MVAIDPFNSEPLAADVLSQLQILWQIEPNDLEAITGTIGHIYRAQTPAGELIIRLLPVAERSFEWLEAELSLILGLQDQIFGVPVPRLSHSQQYIHQIEAYHAMAFEVAKGKHIPYHDNLWWHPLHVVELGQVMAQLHLAVQQEKFCDLKRPDWDAFWPCPQLQDWPEEEPRISRWQAIVKQLKTAVPPESRGLIHGDIHPGNMLISETGQLTLLDFNQTSYFWYGADIAVALFYYLLVKRQHPRQTRMFKSKFLHAILEGYRAVRPFSKTEEPLIDVCFEWVCLHYYFFGLRYFVNQGIKLTPQVKNMMRERFLIYEDLSSKDSKS